jgi:2-desacetyl-2-hydroxyethyl bacteriochlorophyllide A dehydrogenase
VKAVVIERPGEAAFREVDEPAVGPDDVLVRSRRAGVCRTDLELFAGELDPRWVRYPCIPGHEWSGVIEEVGANVTEFQPGERVVCEGIIPCERCRRCRAGETNICENYDQLGFTRAGGYAELVVAPQRVVHRLPDHVSFEAAVLIEPGSVVLRGFERAQLRTGEGIGVVGTGTLGSLALMLAQLYAPSRLFAFGIRDEELELARRLGAQSAINVERNPPDGDDLDVVVEAAGAVPAVEFATRLAREGGRVVLLGIAGAGRSLELPADRIALRDLALLGSVGYTKAVWSRMVGLARDQLVELDPIVTHRFPASEFRQAFDLLDRREGAVAKIVLEHAA